MNIDENLIEAAITKNTKAILPMHYAGAPCEMDKIMEIAKAHNLYVISDAAQAILSKYKKKPVESIGHISTLSFTKPKIFHAVKVERFSLMMKLCIDALR